MELQYFQLHNAIATARSTLANLRKNTNSHCFSNLTHQNWPSKPSIVSLALPDAVLFLASPIQQPYFRRLPTTCTPLVVLCVVFLVAHSAQRSAERSSVLALGTALCSQPEFCGNYEGGRFFCKTWIDHAPPPSPGFRSPLQITQLRWPWFRGEWVWFRPMIARRRLCVTYGFHLGPSPRRMAVRSKVVF